MQRPCGHALRTISAGKHKASDAQLLSVKEQVHAAALLSLNEHMLADDHDVCICSLTSEMEA